MKCQTEQPELRETRQLSLGTKTRRIKGSKPVIKPTINLRIRKMRSQGAGSPWKSDKARDKMEATGLSVVIWACYKLPLESQSHWIV